MPVTTFLNDYEKLNYIAVSDKDVNELYQEVRKIDDRYLLKERIFIKKRFLRKSIVTKSYTLYLDYLAPLDSNWDIQIVTLRGEDIFGVNNTGDNVMCYFYGFLAGHKRLNTFSKPSAEAMAEQTRKTLKNVDLLTEENVFPSKPSNEERKSKPSVEVPTYKGCGNCKKIKECISPQIRYCSGYDGI